MQTKKFVFNLVAVMTVAAFILSACGTAATPTAAPATAMPATAAPATMAPATAAPATAAPATTAPAEAPGVAAMAALLPACKTEGMLTLIATPRNWANYGEIFDAFTAQTGVQINSLDENAGSADELAAIEANKGNKGPQAPDIVDVGYAYGAQGIAAGDYQAYKVSSWDKVPDTILGIPSKDPNGMWIGGYYGVMAMEINTAVVQTPPANWADLLRTRCTRVRLPLPATRAARTRPSRAFMQQLWPMAAPWTMPSRASTSSRT